MSEDQLMSQLEDRFLNEDPEPVELYEDWEEIETPIPSNFKRQRYHRSFDF